MPTEREKIEAELKMNERERAIAKCKEVIQDLYEFEQTLQKLEAERGLPAFYKSKSLFERLKHLGLSQKDIDQMKMAFDAVPALLRGDDLPEPLKQLLAEVADAEYSAIDQLAALLESRKRAKTPLR